MSRRRILRSFAAILSLFIVISGFSATRYVLAHPNDPLQQNVASWARNKGLGALIDQLEEWTHNDAPAVAPADSLALVSFDTLPASNTTVAEVQGSTTAPPETTTTIVDNATPAQRVPTVATQSCPSAPSVNAVPTTSTSTTTTSTTTTTIATDTIATTSTSTTTIPNRPEDISPPIQPAIKGEGEWTAAVRVRTKPIIYATSVRPLWCFGSVVATMAAYNPDRVRTALFNGNEVPGGKGWRNGDRITVRARPSLIASFNGGFRFEHEPGGYITEGRTIRKMRKGYATFGIRADGTSTIGVWGDDMGDLDSWTSLRQNLPPLVMKGKSVYKDYPAVDWGDDFGNKIYNFRSAVCLRTDGMMMFVAVGKVNIGMLADTLIVLGCKTAMELDINGEWPHFAGYNDFGSRNRSGFTIDNRMGDPNRHLNGSTKDFFALFDPETLRAGAVR